jgi:hypothetical protein
MPTATNGLLQNWKCLLACTLVSMSPFQYGIDFGAIGGLQAMKGFLEVSEISTIQRIWLTRLEQVFGHTDPVTTFPLNDSS